jgi:methylase of polypeptide subunit release factors
MKDVVWFEPWSALFAKKKGLDLNQRLLSQLADWFYSQNKHAVTLYMEFDPPQSKTLKEKAEVLFPKTKIRVKQDSCGRDRYLTIFAEPV